MNLHPQTRGSDPAIGACALNRLDGVGAKLLTQNDQIFVFKVPPARWPAARYARGGNTLRAHRHYGIGRRQRERLCENRRRSRGQVLGPYKPVPGLVMPSLIDGD